LCQLRRHRGCGIDGAHLGVGGEVVGVEQPGGGIGGEQDAGLDLLE
jgi:hypothetical protein